jgi:fructose-1,6-bisphosphatase/sedoheptulose 1,7-bisphosphatase-like protein
VVVADARLAQVRGRGAGAKPDGARALGNAEKAFEELGDVVVGEAEVAVAPLLFEREEAALDESRRGARSPSAFVTSATLRELRSA